MVGRSGLAEMTCILKFYTLIATHSHVITYHYYHDPFGKVKIESFFRRFTNERESLLKLQFLAK